MNNMKLQKYEQFVECCNRLGLEDGELTIAELVWRQAEKAMLPQKPSNGVLLGDTVGTSIEKALQDAMVHGSRTYGAKKSKPAMQADKYAFTESELQFLHHVLADRFLGISFRAKRLKLQAARYWGLSDKEDPETESYYNDFKLVRQWQRKTNVEIHRLQNVISKVKKMIRA